MAIFSFFNLSFIYLTFKNIFFTSLTWQTTEGPVKRLKTQLGSEGYSLLLEVGCRTWVRSWAGFPGKLRWPERKASSFSSSSESGIRHQLTSRREPHATRHWFLMSPWGEVSVVSSVGGVALSGEERVEVLGTSGDRANIQWQSPFFQ